MRKLLAVLAIPFVLSACHSVQKRADLNTIVETTAVCIDKRELIQAREHLRKLLESSESGFKVINEYLEQNPKYIIAFGELIEDIGTEKFEKGANLYSLQEVLGELNLLFYIERKLSAASETEREHYLYLLREIGAKALPLLRNMATYHQPGLRAGAIYSLAVLKDSQSITLMKEALADKRNRNVQIYTAFALSCFKDPSGKELILTRLEEALKGNWDFEPPDIYLCLQAAGNLKLVDAVPLLINMLKEKAPSTSGSLAVTDTLQAITSQDFGEDYSKWEEWYEKNKDK